ncbi:MAG: pilus assembly protein [Herpetosiphonaceae bacterium]|nr:pilus assembly protein [Herpetosiphonaceae bacterium]
MMRSRLPTQAECRRRASRYSRPGQAIVELALAITFIMILFSAAVDLGLTFMSYQSLVNAIAEASSYLDLNPALSCTSPCDPFGAADDIARTRFRSEQGSIIHGVGNPSDLNANHIDDLSEAGGAAYVTSMIQIDEADNTQIDSASNGNFALLGNYNPSATDSACQQRVSVPHSLTNPNITSCYIVIRAAMLYKPFILQRLLGNTLTIHAISVRRIVKG